MDIELKNMITVKELKKIDFGSIFNYTLNDDGVFYSLNTSSLVTQELCNITNILQDLNVKYDVDSNYNIQVKIINS